VGRSELFYGYSDEVSPRVALTFDGDKEYSFELNVVREPIQLERPDHVIVSLSPLSYSLIFERKVEGSIKKYYLYDVGPRLGTSEPHFSLSTAYEAVEIHQGIQVWLEGHGGVLEGAHELLALRALLPLPMEL
jgi:hypothetical protein